MGPEAAEERQSLVRQYPWTILAGLSSLGLLVGLLKNTAANDTLGIDFGVFYAGGSLIASDGYDAAYDTARFSNELTTEYFPSLIGTETVSHFISTPTFGWFAQILTVFDFDASLAVWMVLGVVALAASTHLLDLPRWTVLALLVSPAMAFNTSLGQTGPFVLLLFVLLHNAVAGDQRVRAGVLAGLLILKPPLALGYAILWLVQTRRYLTSMAAAAAVGALISLPTLVGGIGPWWGFLGAMSERADSEGSWSQQSQSIPEFLKLLAPQSPAAVTIVFWVVGLVGAAAFVVAAHRRFGNDTEVMSAVALIATVIASPHLLVYDTFFLVIPVAVAYRRGLLTGERAGMLAAIYSVSLAFGPVLYDLQFQAIGRGIGIELPALLTSTWLLVRWHDQAASTVPDGDMSVPVLADA